ncbi:butyrate kinase [Enterococcus sp. HY326]|uniref:butyrate kinase n=1 Tax=Enterococcus sp. HY326 TaxID=2971265 RepID=UPI00223FBD21|nr:butyrate kinase [Enterococcus sp. HY326]
MEAILVINPGSTSTKVAIYGENQLIAETTMRHSVSELAQYPQVMDQIAFRYQLILEFVKDQHMLDQLKAVVGRGGLLKPIPGGTYRVDEAMLTDLREEKYNTHASNLGAILANEFTKTLGIPAFIVDPVVVDELQPLARISGLKGIERRSVAHALNQKAVARKLVKKLGKTYEESSLIVAHLGGGISIGAHQQGKMVEVVNGLDGEGPYTPERSGGLPLVEFAEFILSKQLNLAEVKKLIAGEAGLKSYLGETDLREIQKRIDSGDQDAKFFLDGLCYQVGKSISELAAVFKGQVDAIILTGGLIHSEYVGNAITEYVDWLAPVLKFPGEMEMQALYEGANRVLAGEETPLDYSQM